MNLILNLQSSRKHRHVYQSWVAYAVGFACEMAAQRWDRPVTVSSGKDRSRDLCHLLMSVPRRIMPEISSGDCPARTVASFAEKQPRIPRLLQFSSSPRYARSSRGEMLATPPGVARAPPAPAMYLFVGPSTEGACPVSGRRWRAGPGRFSPRATARAARSLEIRACRPGCRRSRIVSSCSGCGLSVIVPQVAEAVERFPPIVMTAGGKGSQIQGWRCF